MRKNNFTKILLSLFSVAGGLAIYFVLKNEKAVVAHPKGVLAQGELDLIIALIALMLIIVVPTLIALFFVVNRAQKKDSTSNSTKQTSSTFNQIILWMMPAVVVAIMIGVTWHSTHKLDPFNPIKSDVKPLTIQVVALDWKWLFIYPELGIATVNFVQFPVSTPIHFKLSADDSPMNSFWLPQLSGQIYSMTGMITQLHLMADHIGEYHGRAAEINGDGFARMTFIAKASSNEEYDEWVSSVKKSPLELNDETYSELVKRSQNNPITLYSKVKDDLFNEIVMKYMNMP